MKQKKCFVVILQNHTEVTTYKLFAKFNKTKFFVTGRNEQQRI